MRMAANGTMGATISMTLPPAMVDGLEVAARACGASRSELIRCAVSEKMGSMGIGKADGETPLETSGKPGCK